MNRVLKKYVTLFGITFLGTLIIGGILLIFLSLKKQEMIANHEPVLSEELDIPYNEVPLTDQMDYNAMNEQVQLCSDGTRYGNVIANEEYMKQENIYAKEGMSEDEITLVFAGDVLLDDEYSVMKKYKERGSQIENAFDPTLLAYMKSADVCMVNNEFTYTTGGTPTPNKQYTFRANPANVNILNQMGVDIVSLANNHAYDYGEVSIRDTMTTLRGAGIPYVGAGFSKAEAMKPVYYIINDYKIAIVSATQIEQMENPDTKGATDTTAGVFRCWNDDTVLQVLQEAKANSDFVIFYVHWGTESTTQLHWAQTDNAKKYVEAGADVIIGDHPHVLQKIDVVNGAPVIYSLGNFWFNSKERDTGMIEVKLDSTGLKSFRFVPCLQQDCRTIMLDGNDKQRVINYMNSLSTTKLDENGFLLY